MDNLIMNLENESKAYQLVLLPLCCNNCVNLLILSKDLRLFNTYLSDATNMGKRVWTRLDVEGMAASVAVATWLYSQDFRVKRWEWLCDGMRRSCCSFLPTTTTTNTHATVQRGPQPSRFQTRWRSLSQSCS